MSLHAPLALRFFPDEEIPRKHSRHQLGVDKGDRKDWLGLLIAPNTSLCKNLSIFPCNNAYFHHPCDDDLPVAWGKPYVKHLFFREFTESLEAVSFGGRLSRSRYCSFNIIYRQRVVIIHSDGSHHLSVIGETTIRDSSDKLILPEGDDSHSIDVP